MSFRPISALARDLVDRAALERKLILIADLSADELRGWVRMMGRPGARDWYEGERAAIARRAAELGIAL